MSQWYLENRDLFELEIKAMKKFCPNAEYDFFDDGRMFWKINVQTENYEWKFLAVYDTNHPMIGFFKGRFNWPSVTYYIISPSYDELIEMVRISGVSPSYLPHTIGGKNMQDLALDLSSLEDLRKFREGRIFTAAFFYKIAVRWIQYFELGLRNTKTWTKFCGLISND